MLRARATSRSCAPRVRRVPPSVIRFGVIGYGLWGRHHAAAIASTPGATLAAIACGTETSAAAAARDFPDVPAGIGERDVLARAEVDAVAIVTPNHSHTGIGVAALEAGKDVLMEKPLAITRDGCDRLIAAARASGRVLSVGHQLRLSEQYGRVKSLIDAGDVGAPVYVGFSLFRFPFRPGSQGWRYDPARVGSWLLEETVHVFDFVIWYFERVGPPRSVLALGDTHRGAGLSDNVTAILRFPGEAHAVITQTLAAFEYHQTLHVVGTEGSIRSWWSGASDRTPRPSFELRVERHATRTVETVPVAHSGEVVELAAQARATVAAFGERRALVTAEEARKSVVACLAAEQSLREGREIALSF